MDFSFIVPLLALLTLLGVCGMALFGKKKIEDRRHDPNAPKSNLAVDGPQHGVDLLQAENDDSDRMPPKPNPLQPDPPRADPPRADLDNPPRADPPHATLPDVEPAPRPGDVATDDDTVHPDPQRTARM